jgi:hypothetical protein
MIYIKNVPVWERAVRLGVGGGLAIYGLTEVGGLWGVGMLVGALGLALTGVLGVCPACALAGRRLERRGVSESRPRVP